VTKELVQQKVLHESSSQAKYHQKIEDNEEKILRAITTLRSQKDQKIQEHQLSFYNTS
jgi:hypothetical protein